MKSMLVKNIIILILVLVIMGISNNTYAATMDDVISQGDGFLTARNSTLPIDEGELSKTSNDIYDILLTIAIVLAIAIGMIIGLQFLIGSVEEQAKIKETLVPYVIGVFVVFSAFAIWKIVVKIGTDAVPTPTPTVALSEKEAIDKYNYEINVV